MAAGWGRIEEVKYEVRIQEPNRKFRGLELNIELKARLPFA
jgi:hypothetical protein